MFRKEFKKTPIKKQEELTIGDIVGESGGFKIDFKKLQDSIKKCENEKNPNECKSIFKDMGIESY